MSGPGLVAAATTGSLARVGIGIALLVLAFVALRGMQGGGRRRDRQSDLPMPEAAFDIPGAVLAGPFEGSYVGTTFAGDWLDKVTVHDLAVAGRVRATLLEAGLLIERPDALDLALPRRSFTGARLAKELAGKRFETNGLAVIGWRLGEAELDTGLRLDRVDDHVRLVRSVQGMLDRWTGTEAGA